MHCTVWSLSEGCFLDFSTNIKQFSSSTATAVLQDCWILLSNLRWRWTIHSMMSQITYAFHTGARSVPSQKPIIYPQATTSEATNFIEACTDVSRCPGTALLWSQIQLLRVQCAGELMSAGFASKHNSQVQYEYLAGLTLLPWNGTGHLSCLGHFWWSMMIQLIDKIQLWDKNRTIDFWLMTESLPSAIKLLANKCVQLCLKSVALLCFWLVR